jgi:hypothetical protein
MRLPTISSLSHAPSEALKENGRLHHLVEAAPPACVATAESDQSNFILNPAQ